LKQVSASVAIAFGKLVDELLYAELGRRQRDLSLALFDIDLFVERILKR
jgi:hypothetical protein